MTTIRSARSDLYPVPVVRRHQGGKLRLWPLNKKRHKDWTVPAEDVLIQGVYVETVRSQEGVTLKRRAIGWGSIACFITLGVISHSTLAGTYRLPQVAVGGEWQTFFLIRNEADTNSSARIDIRLDNGQTRTQTLQIPARGLVRWAFEEPSQAAVVAGTATVSSNADLVVNVLLQNDIGSVGYAAEGSRKRFQIIWERTDETDTGFAYYIPGPLFTEAEIRISFRDADGTSHVGPGPTYSAGARDIHRALFFSELFLYFPLAPNQLNGLRAVEIESNVSMYVIALRISKGRLASVPVKSLPPGKVLVSFTFQSQNFEFNGVEYDLYLDDPAIVLPMFPGLPQVLTTVFYGESDKFLKGKVNFFYAGYPLFPALTGDKTASLIFVLDNPILAGVQFASSRPPMTGTATLRTLDGTLTSLGTVVVSPR